MKFIQTLKNKRTSKKGFTLAEMLIVLAIIAILVTIAIPIFKTQLDEADAQVDAANERAAKSIAYAEYLLNGDTTQYIDVDDEGNMTVLPSTGSTDAEYTVTIDATTGKLSIS